jgi:hypothetical protein
MNQHPTLAIIPIYIHTTLETLLHLVAIMRRELLLV